MGRVCYGYPRAHPRLRGADTTAGKTRRAQMGSSPLTRGGLLAHQPLADVGGLIPAYAGRTWLCASVEVYPWAHPRLRGADSISLLVFGASSGSSPLTRGGPSRPGSGIARRRLIPAYAGRTAHSHQCGPGIRAHPRLRGADSQKNLTVPPQQGSSPLTRGGRDVRTSVQGVVGLIPAYAGRTSYFWV